MNTPIHRRWPRLAQATLAISLLALTHQASALIVGPYAPDANTLHLWHLDEAAVPAVDAISPGGTNLTALGGGATLNNPSFTGFGTALNTVDGGTAATNNAGLIDAYLAPVTLVNAAGDNTAWSFSDPVTGAFTFEALVWIGFDPAQSLGSVANGGNGRNLAMQIIGGEQDGTGGGVRSWQFRLDPVGFVPNADGFTTPLTQPVLEFINVNNGASVQNLIAPIPTDGADAIVSNGWYHVAVSYNGNQGVADNLQFYWTRVEAGRAQASVISSRTLNLDLNASGAVDFSIGNIGRTTPNANFIGLIDEVRISKVGRAAGQMLFASPLITFDVNPSNTVAAIGQPVTLTVAASGIPPLSYQWRHEGTNLPAATNTSFTIASVSAADAGSYDVVVTNPVSTPATSAAGVLTVRTPVSLVWAGNGADWDTTGVFWDGNGDLTAEAAFAQGDTVRFDAQGGGSPFVNLAVPVNPSLVVVSNETGLDYTFTTFATGFIGSNARLVKQGTGTLSVDTDNNYTGGTAILGGTLQVGVTGPRGSLGSGPITNNGSLVFSRSANLAVGSTISGSGSVAQNGASTLLLLATNNSWTGGTTIGGGTLQIGDGGLNGSLGSGPIANFSILALNTARSFDLTDLISESGSVTVSGGGTHQFMAVNTYAGGTTIAGNSVVRPANNDALGTGTITVGNNSQNQARLELSGGRTLVNTLAIGPRAYLPADTTPQNTAPHFLNVSGTNILSPATDLLLATGGNLLSLQSDSGLLVLTAGVNFNSGGGPKYVLLKGAGWGEIDGTLTQTTVSSLAVHKVDAGTWTLAGTSDLRGPTVVSNGTLVINGALTEHTNVVNVFGGTLAGTGTIAGPVTVAGGTLAPGASLGTLVLTSNLLFQANGTAWMEVNATAGTSDLVSGLTNVTYGGTLVVSNLTGTLTTNNTFKLFDALTYGGAFASIVPATPGADLSWNTSTLAADGTLRISAGGSLATNPTNITATVVSGSQYDLAWPADHVGWTLQSNAVGIANSEAWFPVAGSTATNRIIVPIDPAKPNVFYRLIR